MAFLIITSLRNNSKFKPRLADRFMYEFTVAEMKRDGGISLIEKFLDKELEGYDSDQSNEEEKMN